LAVKNALKTKPEKPWNILENNTLKKIKKPEP
jgi:hypothetical protein